MFVFVPLLRVFTGVNLAAPVLRVWLGVPASEFPTLNPNVAEIPRLQPLARLRCLFGQGDSVLPEYELLLSPRDIDLLRQPPPRSYVGSEVAKKDRSAKVTVRFVEGPGSKGKIATAKVRRRGFIQPPPGKPLPLKLTFKDASVSGFRESHLLPIGVEAGKDTFWWPAQMWLAHELGLKTPRNRLVRVKVNGADWGVFWQFEQWGPTSFASSGLPQADIFGEDDRFLVNSMVAPVLWINPALWKRYDAPDQTDDSEEGALAYSRLADFLRFVNSADDGTFDNHISDYLDLDQVARWYVHMTILDSANEDDTANSRLLFDRVSGKFEMIPWDAWPMTGVRLGHQRRGAAVNHSLIVRLFRNADFLRAYSKHLYRIAERLRGESGALFSDLYLNKAFACAYLSSPYAFPIRNGDLFTLGRLKQILWADALQENIGVMRSFIRRQTSYLIEMMNLVNLLVEPVVEEKPDGTPRQETGRPYRKIANFTYEGHPAATLEQVVLPLRTTELDGTTVSVDVELIPKPLPDFYWEPFHPANQLPETQHAKGKFKVANGRLVLDALNMTLMASYPKLRSPIALYALTTQLYAQDYELRFRSSTSLPIDFSRLRVVVRNTATDREIKGHYRPYHREIHDALLAQRMPPATLAAGIDWLDYDSVGKSLTVNRPDVAVTQTVVLPKGVRVDIPAGTVFSIAPGVSIISYSPLVALGTTQKPIVFRNATPGHPWGVLAVVNATGPSTIRNVALVNAGSGGESGLGMQFGGALNLQLSPAQLENVTCDEVRLKCVSRVSRDGGKYVYN